MGVSKMDKPIISKYEIIERDDIDENIRWILVTFNDESWVEFTLNSDNTLHFKNEIGALTDSENKFLGTNSEESWFGDFVCDIEKRIQIRGVEK